MNDYSPEALARIEAAAAVLAAVDYTRMMEFVEGGVPWADMDNERKLEWCDVMRPLAQALEDSGHLTFPPEPRDPSGASDRLVIDTLIRGFRLACETRMLPGSVTEYRIIIPKSGDLANVFFMHLRYTAEGMLMPTSCWWACLVRGTTSLGRIHFPERGIRSAVVDKLTELAAR